MWELSCLIFLNINKCQSWGNGALGCYLYTSKILSFFPNPDQESKWGKWNFLLCLQGKSFDLPLEGTVHSVIFLKPLAIKPPIQMECCIY